MLRKFLVASVVLLSSSIVMSQTPPPTNPQAANRPMQRGNMQPCLQQAGIDRSAMEQLQSAQREMHEQIQKVCSNASLSPQQKQKQVQEIREQAHQKIASFITPDQQKKLVACRQQHGESAPGILSGAGGGGCGERPHGMRPGGAPGSGNAHPPQAQE